MSRIRFVRNWSRVMKVSTTSSFACSSRIVAASASTSRTCSFSPSLPADTVGITAVLAWVVPLGIAVEFPVMVGGCEETPVGVDMVSEIAVGPVVAPWGVGDTGRPLTSQAANKRQTKQNEMRNPWRILTPFNIRPSALAPYVILRILTQYRR